MADENAPEIPPVFNIPRGVIDGWLSIPSNDEVKIAVTRQDLDNLFFSISNLVSANYELQQCLISYSNGNLEDANAHMVGAQKANTMGLNSVRQLFNALMANAARARNSS